jgi:hypothetical protein
MLGSKQSAIRSKDAVMSTFGRRALGLPLSIATAALLLTPVSTSAQEQQPAASTQPAADVRALADAIRELQGQVQQLHAQVDQLRANERQAQAEARELRHELRLAIAPSPSLVGAAFRTPESGERPAEVSAVRPPTDTPASSAAAAQEKSNADRISKLEEDQQLSESKLNDQYQTKVESSSKYKLRLSGIVLFNAYSNRGFVNNQDFPSLALEREDDDPKGTFGASLRQSQIGIQAFGPEIAGAHTSADVNFDFAGGFAYTPNGVSTGIVRLRTGTVRLDWKNTSLIAGQDHLFFAPLTPTSLASLATPALAYSGNLWGWTPQVRFEHRVQITEFSTLTFQGGILDSLTGQFPASEHYRYPTAGESSGQPAYASRVAWSHEFFGQQLIAGVGGYYGRQNWAFGRHVDGWTGTTDLTVPLGHLFEFTGEYYRGRAVGGLGGGIDQTVLVNGDVDDPATTVAGLDSMGGWAQLKFKPVPKFEVNGAFGHDNPFGRQINTFAAVPIYYDNLFARNQTWFTNFVYQPRSNVLFSVEFRRLRTFGPDSEADTANVLNFSLGYLF